MDLFYRLFLTVPNRNNSDTHMCWKELLEDALSGFRSTDQHVEHIIDLMERRL